MQAASIVQRHTAGKHEEMPGCCQPSFTTVLYCTTCSS